MSCVGIENFRGRPTARNGRLPPSVLPFTKRIFTIHATRAIAFDTSTSARSVGGYSRHETDNRWQNCRKTTLISHQVSGWFLRSNALPSRSYARTILWVSRCFQRLKSMSTLPRVALCKRRGRRDKRFKHLSEPPVPVFASSVADLAARNGPRPAYQHEFSRTFV